MKLRIVLLFGASAFAIGAPVFAQAPALSPVTDEVLQNPEPGDWLNWRRTLDGWGYSPLD
jgi:alcohol dehydrogenase (cytochrome c)